MNEPTLPTCVFITTFPTLIAVICSFITMLVAPDYSIYAQWLLVGAVGFGTIFVAAIFIYANLTK